MDLNKRSVEIGLSDFFILAVAGEPPAILIADWIGGKRASDPACVSLLWPDRRTSTFPHALAIRSPSILRGEIGETHVKTA